MLFVDGQELDALSIEVGEPITGARHDEHARQACELAITRSSVAVPPRFEHLPPLVGADDDRVVARGDLGDQPFVRHLDFEPWVRVGVVPQHGEPIGELGNRRSWLAKRSPRDDPAHNGGGGVGVSGVRDREVRNSRRIERARKCDSDHLRSSGSSVAM